MNSVVGLWPFVGPQSGAYFARELVQYGDRVPREVVG
ncbi:hypothetical protein HG15A2_05740 [Adhaeretor mobilis]|uniref:Uncharacterized protein n=1 Tax=Adhaeretor mobilis TaxID=1930276 RepID=A0A517MR03_9BACT|nr:hypothetical protein HG15A2_05740 [Adhaeretor mobilis]